jgi:hypothetical protein
LFPDFYNKHATVLRDVAFSRVEHRTQENRTVNIVSALALKMRDRLPDTSEWKCGTGLKRFRFEMVLMKSGVKYVNEGIQKYNRFYS